MNRATHRTERKTPPPWHKTTKREPLTSPHLVNLSVMDITYCELRDTSTITKSFHKSTYHLQKLPTGSRLRVFARSFLKQIRPRPNWPGPKWWRTPPPPHLGTFGPMSGSVCKPWFGYGVSQASHQGHHQPNRHIRRSGALQERKILCAPEGRGTDGIVVG